VCIAALEKMAINAAGRDVRSAISFNTNVAKLSTLAIGRTKEICEAIQHSKPVLATNDQFG
jgi:hypothetical protein